MNARNYINRDDEFIKTLESKGYQIAEVNLGKAETILKLFSEHPKHIDIDNNIVAVYEFLNKQTAISQADGISEDGYRISTNEKTICISWTSKPYFYQKGRLIVKHNTFYNENLLNDFKEILGDPITK